MLEKTNQAQEESVKASTNDNSTEVIIIYTIKIILKLLLKILKSKTRLENYNNYLLLGSHSMMIKTIKALYCACIS